MVSFKPVLTFVSCASGLDSLLLVLHSLADGVVHKLATDSCGGAIAREDESRGLKDASSRKLRLHSSDFMTRGGHNSWYFTSTILFMQGYSATGT